MRRRATRRVCARVKRAAVWVALAPLAAAMGRHDDNAFGLRHAGADRCGRRTAATRRAPLTLDVAADEDWDPHPEPRPTPVKPQDEPARRLQSQNTSPAEAHGRVATCSHRAFARGAVRAVSGYRDTQSLGAQGVVCRGARIDVVWASPD